MMKKLILCAVVALAASSCHAMDKATNLEQLATMAELQQECPKGSFPIHYQPETAFVRMAFLNPQEETVTRYIIHKNGEYDEEESGDLTEIEQTGLAAWKELNPEKN